MFWFKQKLLYLKSNSQNLNTSYVLVQGQISLFLDGCLNNLNTSYVLVQVKLNFE